MYFERAERARYRSTTRVRVCASVSNRQLGSGLEVPFKTSFAQLAELHTVSHSAATPARGNMPAATRVKFNELFVGAWYPTDPPVYPRCLCEHERAIKPYGLEVSKTLRKDRRDSPAVEPET